MAKLVVQKSEPSLKHENGNSKTSMPNSQRPPPSKIEGHPIGVQSKYVSGPTRAEPKYRELTHFLEHMGQERRHLRSPPPIEKSQENTRQLDFLTEVSFVH
jgi:hypothetical protein